MGTISGTVSTFRSGGAIAGGRALTIESSLMMGLVKVMNPLKEALAQVSSASSEQKWK